MDTKYTCFCSIVIFYIPRKRCWEKDIDKQKDKEEQSEREIEDKDE